MEEPNTLSGHEESAIHNLSRAIRWADQNGMLWEFMDSFLADYDREKNVYEAINHANSEWDL